MRNKVKGVVYSLMFGTGVFVLLSNYKLERETVDTKVYKQIGCTVPTGYTLKYDENNKPYGYKEVHNLVKTDVIYDSEGNAYAPDGYTLIYFNGKYYACKYDIISSKAPASYDLSNGYYLSHDENNNLIVDRDNNTIQAEKVVDTKDKIKLIRK